MANHASADKRNRQRLVRTARNRAVRTAIKSSLKRARVAIASGDASAAKEPVRLASIALAQAVSKGVLHQRNASRTISRINSQLAALS